MANYKPIGTSFDRAFRNDLNENFSTLDAVAANARVKADKAEADASKAVVDSSTAKSTAESVQSQLNTIVIESGTSDAEVLQARGNAPVLNERLNNVDAQLAKTTQQLTDIAYDVKANGLKGDGVTDDTNAFNTFLATVPEGSKVIFPTGTYKGNFISYKSLDVDFMGSTLIPVADNKAVFKFEGTIGAAKTVTGNPLFGQTSFVVNDVSGLTIDGIGYLVDDARRPADSKPDINVELIKIKSIDIITKTVYVYDMLRSTMNTGTVKFYPVTNLIRNPKVRNLNIEASNTHTFPNLWFYGCDTPSAENVQVKNSFGHAIRHEYCYDWTTKNIRVIKPRDILSGNGYGITGHKSRIGLAHNTYGIGTRHLIDFDCSYSCRAERVVEDDGKSAVVVLSHNGFGGNNSVDDVICTSDSFSVEWDKQGFDSTNLSAQVVRDVSIKNINHTVPTLKTNAPFVSVNIQQDYATIEINNINVRFTDTSVAPTTLSQAVRLTGNVKGIATIKNVRVNQVGAAVWADVRGNYTGNHHLVIDNISVDVCDSAVRVRGILSTKIDNIFVATSCVNAVVIESYLSSVPFRSVFGDNFSVASGNIVSTSGINATGLRGKAPRLMEQTSASVTLNTTGSAIDINKIMNSGGYLRLLAPTGSDATLDAITPFGAPIWTGQDMVVEINQAGYTGARGNIIIPIGSTTYADGGVQKTLNKGEVYRLIGYNGKWRVAAF